MLSRLRIAALLVLPTAAALVSAAACEVGTLELGSNCPDWVTDECCPCPVPEACPDGSPPLPAHCSADGGDAGSEASADGASALCGECTPKPPGAWKGPVHVAIGAAISLAECPASLPNVVFEGQAAPEAWSLCPACSCDAPVGSCELPTTWTVSSAPCNDPGSGVKTNLDPSAGWDGICTTEDAIAAGKLCGGSPCVQSIAVSRPILQEQPCVPRVDETEFELPRFSGGPFALSMRACAMDAQWPSCSDSDQKLCVPRETGFSVCISHSGDEACPEGWNDRHVFYDMVDDERFCEPCTCGLPTGGVCEIRYRIFEDSACLSELMAIKLSSTGEPNPCTEFSVPGVALASRTAEVLAYAPGACEPMGGKIAGEVILSQPTTFCCLTASS